MGELQPTQWTRETRWRQGSVLPDGALQRFELHHAAKEAVTCAVVISHDCDLANDDLNVEPLVELIIGQVTDKIDGNYTWGKAPRTVHYPVSFNGTTTHIELVSTNKHNLPKCKLAAFEPDHRYTLDAKALAVLRNWLGSRYNREAFPDEFVRRMHRTKVDSKLAKILEKHGDLISFVYFDIDSGQNIEHDVDDPYQLSIVLVFPPGDDAELSADEAEKVVKEVEENVSRRLMNSKNIKLMSCFAISEDDLPVSKARTLTQWHLEYLTLKADDGQQGPLKL